VKAWLANVLGGVVAKTHNMLYLCPGTDLGSTGP